MKHKRQPAKNGSEKVEEKYRTALHQSHGFTLIEVMIALAIISILAAIAIPSYQSSVLKGGRAEGKSALLDTAQRLERCFSEFNAYNNANCPSFPNPVPTENGRYAIAFSAVTATTYTLQAMPQSAQAGDTQCGTLTLNQAGAKTESGTGTVAECW